jgi:hypothetical protein
MRRLVLCAMAIALGGCVGVTGIPDHFTVSAGYCPKQWPIGNDPNAPASADTMPAWCGQQYIDPVTGDTVPVPPPWAAR